MKTPNTRKCRVCQKVKPLEAKYFNNRYEITSTPPFRWDCKVCYNNNKRTNPRYFISKMLQHARNRAELYNRDFEITVDDIYIPKTCPVLGMKLVHGWEDDENSPTLERIDNNKGYLKENIMVVSALSNRIKNSATPKQILTVGWFYKKLKKRIATEKRARRISLRIFKRIKNLRSSGED